MTTAANSIAPSHFGIFCTFALFYPLYLLRRLRQCQIVFARDNFAAAFLFQFAPGVAGHRAAVMGDLFVLREPLRGGFPSAGTGRFVLRDWIRVRS